MQRITSIIAKQSCQEPCSIFGIALCQNDLNVHMGGGVQNLTYQRLSLGRGTRYCFVPIQVHVDPDILVIMGPLLFESIYVHINKPINQQQ